MGVLALALLALHAMPAWGQDEGLRRCRALADAGARLACYDALPLASRPASVTEPPAAAAPAPTAAGFGLPAAPEALERIESRFEGLDKGLNNGRFEGWGPRTRFRLANGQVWQVVDDSSASYWLPDPKVVVRRAALGSFVLEIEGAKRTVRVRRVE